MGNVIPFTSPDNKRKMEARQVSYGAEEFLRDRIAKCIINMEKHPEDVARLIRAEYKEQFKELAFPVIELAKDFNIQVAVADFPQGKSASGTIKGYLGLYPTNQNRCARIVVSNAESYGHQRWTVAHELWHYLLHAQERRDKVEYYPEDSSNYDLHEQSEEANANRFATELLMPEHIFRYIYKNCSFWRRETRLAQMFMVSKEAVKRRVRDLRL